MAFKKQKLKSVQVNIIPIKAVNKYYTCIYAATVR